MSDLPRRVPMTMRDFFFEDPFFRSSWDNFERVREAMFQESRDMWRRFDDDFRNMAWDGNLWVVVIVKSWVKKHAVAPDWLNKSEQPIRSQISKLTELLTMTRTHKFPLQRPDQTESNWPLRDSPLAQWADKIVDINVNYSKEKIRVSLPKKSHLLSYSNCI